MNPTLQKYLAGAAILIAWTALVVMHFLPAAPLQTAFEAALATLGGHASISSLFNLFSGALKQAVDQPATPKAAPVTATVAISSAQPATPAQ